MPGNDCCVHCRVEHGHSTLAARLRRVHRDVGVPEQLVGPDLGPAGDRDPNAAADHDFLTQHRQRDLERLDDPVGDRHCPIEPCVVLEEDRELVAAEPGRQVVGPDAALDAFGDRGEKAIAGGVTEGVVDDLEVVEVQEEHDEPAAVALRGEPDVDLLREHQAVGQPGQWVVIGLVAELLLEPRQLGERLLELAVLEGHGRLIGERLEEAQIVVLEACSLGQPVGDRERADDPRFADEGGHHRLADLTPAHQRPDARSLEERPAVDLEAAVDGVLAVDVDRNHDLRRPVVDRCRSDGVAAAAGEEHDLGHFGAEHLASVVEQGNER